VARKYAFNPPKIRFHLNIKLPTNATRKSEKRLEKNNTAASVCRRGVHALGIGVAVCHTRRLTC
jgi:hypothetical protein